SDGPYLWAAFFAPARVRGVILQGDFLVDHLDQGVQGDRILGVFLCQLQESQRELVHSRQDLVALFVSLRSRVNVLRRSLVFLEKRLVLLGRRMLTRILGRRRRHAK